LGLARGASREEIRRAYRRLAKIHHPDAAGPGALPRFLAIQAAYEQLIVRSGGRTGRTPGARPAPPRRPWEADPDRSDATRRAYGGRSRTTGANTPGSNGAGSQPGGAQSGNKQRASSQRDDPRRHAGSRPTGGSAAGPGERPKTGSTRTGPD